MGIYTTQPEFRLLDVLAQLQVDEPARLEAVELFRRLPEDKRERLLTVLQTVDEDIARLVVATVPKMREALDGKGTKPETLISDAVKTLT